MAGLSKRPATAETTCSREPIVTGWIAFLAHFIFILAAWTLVIKYLFPVGFAMAEGRPWTSHIMWDLWPVAHVWLGWALLRRSWYIRPLAVGMSIVEIIIIVTLFALFLSDPEWDIWKTGWFINKCFVLLCFILILGTGILGRLPKSAVASENNTTPAVKTA